ncbi:MAG: alanine racemase [Gemmatimonadetes bacterium]|nr:alanine racemase [Gemmatimonadota bacterium]
MTRQTQIIRERAWLEVNLVNLAANAETVRAAARGARLLPMVKADGYGLGALRVAHTLERHVDPWGFGVATVAEGATLRAAGIRRPIVVFTPALAEHQARCREFDLQAVLDDPAIIHDWKLPYQLEIDTGMGRSGVRWDDPDLARYATAQMQGAFMHFHSAEDHPASVRTQWERFQAAVTRLPARPALLFVANSAGVWKLEEKLDLVRPGMFLYGCIIAKDMPAPKPVASLRSRVVSVRGIRKGEGVSYGGEWISPRDARIATIGFGYADGLHRSVQGKARVLIRGRSYPLVGRITMDMVLADVTDGGETVERGDRVTLVGTDENETITWEDLAGWAGTNTYEMMAGLGTRVERVYVGE